MYVVTVEFRIAARFRPDFVAAVLNNARISRIAEPGCRQFDVCVAGEDDGPVFLYEVYDDEDAFDAHVASEHFCRFDASVKSWVTMKRVTIYRRIE